jgi:LemA protein
MDRKTRASSEKFLAVGWRLAAVSFKISGFACSTPMQLAVDAAPLRRARFGAKMLFGILVFGAIVGVVFAFVATYNGLVAAAEKAARAWNDLDTLLRQRHDEIPKIAEICEPHLVNERALVERLLQARTAVFAARQTRDADELGLAEAGLRAAATALMTRAAAHPTLAASPAFGLLRQRQATLDLEIKDRRDGYNDAVRAYNAAINRVPGRVIALLTAFPPLRTLDFERAGR